MKQMTQLIILITAIVRLVELINRTGWAGSA